MTRRLLTLLSLGLVALAMPFSARAANLLQNGSLEDLNHSFVNTTCGYEALFANSTAIADWTVSSSTINEVAWGNGPTCDGFQAADGTFFVDLTGFGFDSPNGALEQQMHNLIVNKTYQVTFDSFINGSLPLVTVDGVPVALSSGGTFVVGITPWTVETGTFTATSTNPLFKVMNNQAGQTIDFVDNFSVTGPSSSKVPEPAALALVGIGLASFRFIRRRKSN